LLPLLLRLLLHLAMNHQKQLTRLLLLRLMRLPAKLQLMLRLMRLQQLMLLLLLRPRLRLMRLPAMLQLMKRLLLRRLQRWTQMTR
jgi:hypothetical protein